MNKLIKNKKAFTMIELIVIMAVLAIFVTMGVPRMSGFTKEANMTKLLNDAKVIEDAAHRYYLQHGEWPRAESEMTAEEVNTFTDKVLDVTEKVIALEPEGKYYALDMIKLAGFVNIKSDPNNFIIQNPVGSVYILNPENNKALGEGFTIKEKPIAIISMTPEEGLTTKTNIVWDYNLSITQEGCAIIDAEWEGKQDIYTTEGEYTVKLRVKSSNGLWSDWVEKNFYAIDPVHVSQISAGANHTLALMSDGTVWAWGSNSYGQLAIDKTTNNKNAPTKINALANIKQVTAGHEASFAVGEDGTVWAWGKGQGYQLGLGSLGDRTSPTKINSLPKIKSIRAGYYCVFAQTDNGENWYVWGSNSFGILGDNTETSRTTPYLNPYLKNFKQVSPSLGEMCVVGIDKDNIGLAWGRTERGFLGTGVWGKSKVPVKIKGEKGNGFLTDLKQIELGGNFAIALKNDGTVWGLSNNIQNSGYEAVDPPLTNKEFPVKIRGENRIGYLTGVKNIDVGAHAFAIKDDGRVFAWGHTVYGERGKITGNGITPNEVISLQNIKSVSLGHGISFAIREDDTIWALGRNNLGQLGVKDYTNKSTPTEVIIE